MFKKTNEPGSDEIFLDKLLEFTDMLISKDKKKLEPFQIPSKTCQVLRTCFFMTKFMCNESFNSHITWISVLMTVPSTPRFTLHYLNAQLSCGHLFTPMLSQQNSMYLLNTKSQFLHQHQPQNQQQLHWHNHHKCLHLKNQQQQQKITDQCTELRSLGSVLTGKKINNFDMTQTVTLQQCNIYCSENSHLSLSISKKTCFVLHSIVSFSDLWLFVFFVYFIVCLIVYQRQPFGVIMTPWGGLQQSSKWVKRNFLRFHQRIQSQLFSNFQLCWSHNLIFLVPNLSDINAKQETETSWSRTDSVPEFVVRESQSYCLQSNNLVVFFGEFQKNLEQVFVFANKNWRNLFIDKNYLCERHFSFDWMQWCSRNSSICNMKCHSPFKWQ